VPLNQLAVYTPFVEGLHYNGPGGHGDGDATGDGLVNFTEFRILSSEFGQGLSCP